MSKKGLFFIFLILFFKLSRAEDISCVNIWVIWNIGQGQWVTHVQPDQCIHYDIGGDLGSYKNVQASLNKLCSRKQNRIFLSHWDFDHFSNLASLSQKMAHVCWASRPPLNRDNLSIQKIVDLKISPCAMDWKLTSEIKNWFPQTGKTSNDFSIVSLENSFLMPGDSPIKQEKIWSLTMKIQNVRVLILGHHGSKTSTGNELLQHLPHLKLAIASARLSKYGHPHAETLSRLRKNKTPVLKTEDWGSIWFL